MSPVRQELRVVSTFGPRSTPDFPAILGRGGGAGIGAKCSLLLVLYHYPTTFFGLSSIKTRAETTLVGQSSNNPESLSPRSRFPERAYSLPRKHPSLLALSFQPSWDSISSLDTVCKAFSGMGLSIRPCRENGPLASAIFPLEFYSPSTP
jgi:hypothetical protein